MSSSVEFLQHGGVVSVSNAVISPKILGKNLVLQQSTTVECLVILKWWGKSEQKCKFPKKFSSYMLHYFERVVTHESGVCVADERSVSNRQRCVLFVRGELFVNSGKN